MLKTACLFHQPSTTYFSQRLISIDPMRCIEEVNAAYCPLDYINTEVLFSSSEYFSFSFCTSSLQDLCDWSTAKKKRKQFLIMTNLFADVCIVFFCFRIDLQKKLSKFLKTVSAQPVLIVCEHVIKVSTLIFFAKIISNKHGIVLSSLLQIRHAQEPISFWSHGLNF